MSAERVVSLFGDETLHPKAWEFFQDNSRYCLATAGRRGAKSYTGAKKFWRKVWGEDWPAAQSRPYNPGAAKRGTSLWWERRPRLHYWVVADTYELLDEPKRYLLQFLPAELFERADGSKGRWWLRGDILIEFKTVHNPTGKVGSGLNGMWIEEAARLRDDAWNGFLRPTLADKHGWLIATTTPLGQDWTYRDLYMQSVKGVEGYGFHTWKASDNIMAPHVVAEAKIAKETMPEEYFLREWEASYQAFIGQIYKEFDESVHVIDEMPKNLQFINIVGGQDWGFGAPGAQEIAKVSPGANGLPHLWFVDETYSEEELVEEFWIPKAKEAKKNHGVREFIADPAEPDNIKRFKNAGIQISGHRNYGSGTFDEHVRSIRAGIRTTRVMLKNNRIHILRKKCPNLIEEFKSYRWAKTTDGRLRDEPQPHQKDHAVTTARYIASGMAKGANFIGLNVST